MVQLNISALLKLLYSNLGTVGTSPYMGGVAAESAFRQMSSDQVVKAQVKYSSTITTFTPLLLRQCGLMVSCTQETMDNLSNFTWVGPNESCTAWLSLK